MPKPFDHSTQFVAPAAATKLQDTLAYPPRAFDADRAGAYVGLSRSKFLELVDVGDAPQPIDLGGCPRWDRRKLDDWLDAKNEYIKKPSRKKTLADLLQAEPRCPSSD
jgi:predicted DNA-binding transcriptional regulator AlpA